MIGAARQMGCPLFWERERAGPVIRRPLVRSQGCGVFAAVFQSVPSVVHLQNMGVVGEAVQLGFREALQAVEDRDMNPVRR